MYPWGNTWDGKKANVYSSADGYAQTAPVGSFSSGASPYGALDMAGNVWEWVQDWYDENYYQNGPRRNPRGPEKGYYEVMRGGAWDFGLQGASSRNGSRPGARVDYVGMRCAQ